MGVEHGVQICYGFGGAGRSDLVRAVSSLVKPDALQSLMGECGVDRIQDLWDEHTRTLPRLAGFPDLVLLRGGESWGDEPYVFVADATTDLFIAGADSVQRHFVLPDPVSAGALRHLQEKLGLDEPLAWHVKLETF